MEILIVDNHSDDESMGFLRAQFQSHPQVRIIETKDNLGFGGGYGEGIKHARGEFVLINNPEKVLENDGLRKLVEKMQSDTSIGILGPKLIHPDGSVRLSPRTFPTPLDVIAKRTTLQHVFPKRVEKYLQLDEDPNKERETDWLAGGCLLLRKNLFDSLGGFDPRYFLFFEDIDLCRTCWEKGKRVVYFPSVTGTDRKKRLSEGGPLSMLQSAVGRTHIRSAVRYFRKWGLKTGRPKRVAVSG